MATGLLDSILSVPLIRPDLPKLEDVADQFREILGNGRITNFGKYNNQFEAEVGGYLGTQAATTSSGTMGMVLVLKALGIGAGQKVVVPSLTFVATAQAVLYAGATPVFADVGDDLTLCPQDLERLLEQHAEVAGVIPVHLYGLPAQVDAIQDIVDRHSARRGRAIRVVYDSAHAFGSATADGRRCGTFGDAEVFSLSVTKLLVSVEGGMVTSRDPDLIERVKKLRNYGFETNYNAHWPGLNGKMSEFHAIIGLHSLSRVDELLAVRAEKAAYYARRVSAGCQCRVPAPPAGVRHSFKDFTVLVPPAWAGDRRDGLMQELKSRGVETRPYFFPPVHEQTFFRQYADRQLPNTEDLSRRVVTLPFFSQITQEQMDYVAQALSDAERAVGYDCAAA